MLCVKDPGESWASVGLQCSPSFDISLVRLGGPKDSDKQWRDCLSHRGCGRECSRGDQAEKGRWELGARAEQGEEKHLERPVAQSWRRKQGVEKEKRGKDGPRLIGHLRRGNRKFKSWRTRRSAVKCCLLGMCGCPAYNLTAVVSPAQALCGSKPTNLLSPHCSRQHRLNSVG